MIGLMGFTGNTNWARVRFEVRCLSSSPILDFRSTRCRWCGGLQA
jgi:hypothetical protein